MKRWLLPFLLFAGLTTAATIRTFVSGDIITAADLNANFSHIHNLMVGGHGARLVNADVSANAVIAHSKMATPGVLPKAIFIIGSGVTPCSAGTCTVTGAAGATTSSVVYVTPGIYTATWTAARTNSVYLVQLTSQYCAAGAGCFCSLQTGTSTTAFTVLCTDAAGTATNAVVGVTVMDDSN